MWCCVVTQQHLSSVESKKACIELLRDGMDYTRHTPLLFLPWQLAQHSSRAYPQSSSSERPKCSDEPPVPTGIAMKLLEGLGVCVAPGQLLLWGNSSDCKLMLSLLNWPMQQGAWVSLLFSRAWLLRASRFGQLIQEISWEELSCYMHFCTSNSEICTGILVLPTLVGQCL